MSRRPVLTAENVRLIRKIAAVPHWKRRGQKSLRVVADLLGVSYHAVTRAGRNEQRCYRELSS